MGKQSTVVVVSHYNPWPADQLVALLDQMHAIPAGAPFTARVVVNRAEDRDLVLPPRLAQVEVIHRENTGYNIGAWEAGWRHGKPADFYLFLQEECQIRRPGWLKAFIRPAGRPRIGLVGENIAYFNTSWDDIDDAAVLYNSDPRTVAYRALLTRMGVKYNELAEHLQSLVLCARREVLEDIGGFRIGVTKEEAIACEFAISKAAEALGYRFVQVGLRPFEYFRHPQWDKERAAAASLAWRVHRFLCPFFLGKLQRKRREWIRNRRGGVRPNPLVTNPYADAPLPANEPLAALATGPDAPTAS